MKKTKILLIGILCFFAVNAIEAQRFPKNVRYIGGNFINNSPYFKTLQAAWNDVTSLATVNNPYVFDVQSDTLWITDWAVYKPIIDSLVGIGKIKWAGFGFGGGGGGSGPWNGQDIIDSSLTGADIDSGAIGNNHLEYSFRMGLAKLLGNQTYYNGTFIFGTLGFLDFNGGHLILPRLFSMSYANEIGWYIGTDSIGVSAPFGAQTLATRNWMRTTYGLPSGLVHTLGAETVGGMKNFTGGIVVAERRPLFIPDLRDPEIDFLWDKGLLGWVGSGNAEAVFYYSLNSPDTFVTKRYLRSQLGNTPKLDEQNIFTQLQYFYGGLNTGDETILKIPFIADTATWKVTYPVGSICRALINGYWRIGLLYSSVPDAIPSRAISWFYTMAEIIAQDTTSIGTGEVTTVHIADGTIGQVDLNEAVERSDIPYPIGKDVFIPNYEAGIEVYENKIILLPDTDTLRLTISPGNYKTGGGNASLDSVSFHYKVSTSSAYITAVKVFRENWGTLTQVYSSTTDVTSTGGNDTFILVPGTYTEYKQPITIWLIWTIPNPETVEVFDYLIHKTYR